MTTLNVLLSTNTWTNIVEPNDTDFLVTWDDARVIEFASTELNQVPVVKGHRLPREKCITREDVGAGYVWAKLTPDGTTTTLSITVSKSNSTMGSTGGFDSVEGVHKVAMMVWNPLTLGWERGTQSASSGASGSGIAPDVKLTKRMDLGSKSVIYIGEAVLGTSEQASGWWVKRVNFNAAGNPIAEMYAVGSWDSRYSLTYQ